MKTKAISTRSGFSLIELLIVISIMVVLTALCSVPFTGLMRSTQITTAANLVSGEIAYARTAAIARSTTTEVRFFTSATPPYMQTLVILNDGTITPLAPAKHFPSGIAVASNSGFSGVMGLSEQTVPTGQPYAGATYRAVRFDATGEVHNASTGDTLDSSNNYLTLLSSRNSGANQLPDNWITLSIDDRTGAVRRYQP